MHEHQSLDTETQHQLARRIFLGRTASAALEGRHWRRCWVVSECQRSRSGGCSRGVINPLHLAPKAKRIIFLTMAGGPSHLETFDYKPKLAEMHGQPMPESFTKGQPIAQLQGQGAQVLRPAAPVQEVRRVGAGDLRDLSADRHDRRRHLHRPLAADRGDQPRPGPHVHEHGHDDLRPARRWARG